MRTLLLKDILVQKANVYLGAFYSLIFFLAFGLMEKGGYSAFAYSVSGIAVGGMILIGSFAADKNETPRFVLSLPITRGDAVNAKFLLLFLATLFGTLSAALLGAVFAIPAIGWSDKIIGGIELLRITAGMLILTILIPFYFRFGQRTIRYVLIGGMGLLVVGQVAGMVALSISSGSGRGVDVLDRVMEFLFEGDPLSKNLWLLAAGAVICVASYLVSQEIYRRKDL